MIDMAKEYFTRKEAAQYLTQLGRPLSWETLGNLASNNNALGGPPFIKHGFKVMYRKSDLDEWLEKNRRYVG